MVPFGLTEAQFATRYRRILEKVSDSSIARITSVLQLPVPPAVLAANVEVFMGEDGSAPSAWMYFHGENNKVDSRDPTIFTGRSMDLALDLAGLACFDERYFDPEQFPGTSIAANVTKSWLAECWWKAGGWPYTVPTMLSIHDDHGDGTIIALSRSDA
jgi:hypothetical protein